MAVQFGIMLMHLSWRK